MKNPLRKSDGKGLSLLVVSVLLVFATVFLSVCFSPLIFATEEETTEGVLDNLQEEYDELEQKINESEKNLQVVENGKTEQKQNISALETQIDSLGDQISVLEKRINVLSGDISRLNSSISTINKELDALSAQIEETDTLIYETERSVNLLSAKIHSRLIMSYMAGQGSYLEVLLGASDLADMYTKFQMIQNISAYEDSLIGELDKSLETLNALNASLLADEATVKEKKAVLTGEKSSLTAKQSDIESSAYVLEMKKQLSQHKYTDAVSYFKTLNKSSSDYSAMLKLLSDEQDKVDQQMNNYLLQYGSSADDALTEGTTAAYEEESTVEETTTKKSNVVTYTTVAYVPKTIGSQFTTTTTTTTTQPSSVKDLTVPTTKVNIITAAEDLIWPLPYKNCYISAYYGQYPSGGTHHGIDICVRGGTQGKKVVAAGNGRVIRSGYGHWSMGNYVIIDHGYGLFTAYYHMQVLYVEQGDTVGLGDTIGLAGSTGNSTGPHLHFEVRISKNGAVTYTDPLKWVSMPS